MVFSSVAKKPRGAAPLRTLMPMTHKVLGTVLAASLLMAVTACEDSTDTGSASLSESPPVPTPTPSPTPTMVPVPADSQDFEGDQYEDVLEELQAAGFTAVTVELVPDLITGWLVSDGEVEDVEIDGSTEYAEGDEFAPDAEVVVSYHTFPPDEPEEEEPAEEPSEPPMGEQPEVLTVTNSPALEQFLNADPCSDGALTFARDNEGRVVEFSGSVADMAPHGSYDTRYDILIVPGGDGPSTTQGPTLQFRDINMLDLNFVGRTPNRFGVGDRALFRVALERFDKASCLVMLEPVKTRVQ